MGRCAGGGGAGGDEGAQRWQRLWSDIRADAELDDPAGQLSKARASAAVSDWPRALACYSEAFGLEPDQDGQAWFELAAVQVLADDMEGYRRTCERLLDPGAARSRIRDYHVVRACTLAPLAGLDLSRAEEIGTREIRPKLENAWALTEAGAIRYRAGRDGDAIVLLKRSIYRDPRVGMAVLNWLRLALANDRAGSPTESRRWFTKAQNWFERLGDERPPSDGPSSIHLHNWLEAQILRREAAAAIAGRGFERPGGGR